MRLRCVVILLIIVAVTNFLHRGVLSLSCGRTSCYGSDSPFYGDSPIPFLPNQRCSCSSRCVLFDDCCDDFRAVSKSYINIHSFRHLIAEIDGERAIDQAGVTCSLPRHLVYPGRQVRFGENVPPFYRVGTCPEAVPEKQVDQDHPQASNPFVVWWPVVDVATGIVFDNINIAQCHSPQKKTDDAENDDVLSPRLPSIVKGPFKYWPSFSILCDNNNQTVNIEPNFSPFNPQQVHRLLNEQNCVVELTDPKNPVMFPVSFCVPFTQARRVVQNGCIVSGRDEATSYDEGCLNGKVETVAIYDRDSNNKPSNTAPVLFRNADCAKCAGLENENEHNCSFNVEEGWRFQKQFRVVQFRKTLTFDSFRMMMDFTWSPDDFTDLNSELEERQNCVSENEVYVPFLGACHQLTIKTRPEPPSLMLGNQSNCFVEIKRSRVDYSVSENGTLLIKSKTFQPNEYQMVNDNQSVFVRYCFGAMSPGDDDDMGLLGEREVPIRDIISRFITLGFMCMSVVSLAFMLGVYILFPQLRNLPGKLTMCLAATLMVALSCYGTGVLALEKIWYPLCLSMSIMIQFCFIASFAFASCLNYDIWRTFKSQAGPSSIEEGNRLFVQYCCFSLGFPTIVVLASVIAEFLPMNQFIVINNFPRPRYAMPVAVMHPADFHQGDYHEHSVWVCWMMNRTGVLAYYKVPIGFCVCLSFIFLAMTIVHIRHASQHSVRAGRGHTIRLRRRLIIYLKLTTIMGMTWLFGFVAAVTNIEALWIPFGLSNALQGLYVCVAFVFTKKVSRLLRGWAAGENRQTIDPRKYATTNNNNNTASTNASQSVPLNKEGQNNDNNNSKDAASDD